MILKKVGLKNLVKVLDLVFLNQPGSWELER